ncbi:MAG TPA: hypothetical protein PLY93_12175, partial [Turneriella sp.]|nr:hypothetical protein [Turneriella sp.]
GAPLAKFAEKSEQILQFIPNPVTLMAASVISLRSRGLKDLSHGQSGLPSENVVLQKNVHYVLIAGGLGQNENGVVNKVVGDGMVRRPSATQKQMPQSSWLSTAFPWFKKSTPISVEVLSGVGHLALRTSDEVYAVIQKYFRN